MASLKCPRCGFVNWVDTSACKRCGAAVCRVDAPTQSGEFGRFGRSAPGPQRPGWVEVALSGVKTRNGAVICLVAALATSAWVCVAAFCLLAAYAGASPPLVPFFVLMSGVGFGLLAGLWYWRSIRWMDEHDAWPARR